MILVKKNGKIPPALILDKLGLEIMFDIHQGRNQALPDNKKKILQKWPYWIFFSKGLTHDFGQKLENFSWFVFGQNRPRNNV